MPEFSSFFKVQFLERFKEQIKINLNKLESPCESAATIIKEARKR